MPCVREEQREGVVQWEVILKKSRDPTALATSNALENLLPELLLTPLRASGNRCPFGHLQSHVPT